jgi:nucleoside-diphosphate-sugar epimerase
MQDLQDKKMVVTGGAGFIGSHLVDALIDNGNRVIVVDTLLTGKKEYVHKDADFHKTDIRDTDALQKLFCGADIVFHLAALPRVQPSIQNPGETHDINVNGTLSVLLAARDAGVRRVVYSASSSVYGDQDILPISESAEARPLSPYALQKYIGEQYCALFSRIYGIETVSLRYFNVYGARAASEGAYALVIPKFIAQLKIGAPLTIVPDGTQTRDFTHVRDVVRANLRAAVSEDVGAGEAINIGGGLGRSINDIAALIGGPTVSAPPRLEPKFTCADIALAKKLLGWEPQEDFEAGVRELMDQ